MIEIPEPITIYLTDLPLVYKWEDKIVRIYGLVDPVRDKFDRSRISEWYLYVSTYLGSEYDKSSVFNADKRQEDDMSNVNIFQGMGGRSEDDEYIISGLFEYLYELSGKDSYIYDNYIAKVKEIKNDKMLSNDEKRNKFKDIDADLRKRRKKLSYKESFMSVAAHEETHLFTHNEIAAYYVELMTLKTMRVDD